MKRLKSGPKAGTSIRVFAPLAAAVLLQLPAHAQAYSYLPYALGSTLFYGLRWMSYSPLGQAGYSNPFWYGSNLLGRSTRGLGGTGYNGYSPYGNPNFYAVNNDEEPADPNVVRYGPPVNSQPNSKQRANNPQPAWNPNSGRFQPYYPPNTSPVSPQPPGNAVYPGTNPAAPLAYSPAQAPPAPYGAQAPAYGANFGRQPVASAPQGVAVGAPAGLSDGHKHSSAGSSHGHAKNGQAPLAVSFLNSINTDCDGDIRKAMANPATRSWAQCLGVLPKGHKAGISISDSRADSINAVLRDESLDPVSKLDTLKILLKD